MRAHVEPVVDPPLKSSSDDDTRDSIAGNLELLPYSRNLQRLRISLQNVGDIGAVRHLRSRRFGARVWQTLCASKQSSRRGRHRCAAAAAAAAAAALALPASAEMSSRPLRTPGTAISSLQWRLDGFSFGRLGVLSLLHVLSASFPDGHDDSLLLLLLLPLLPLASPISRHHCRGRT